MFSISKRFTFEAAHQLPHHDGKCRRLHGHSWVGWVEVSGSGLHQDGPKTGMLVDYGDLAAAVQGFVDDSLDHHYLNDTLGLESPTSEAIAQWLYRSLREAGTPVSSVTIEETCSSRCTYREE